MEIISSLNHMMHYPYHSFLDVFDHLSTGYFLAKQFFPDSSAIKTGLRTLVAAALPDFDFFIPGIHHRGLMHHEGAVALPFAYSLFEKDKLKALEFSGLAVGLHLFVDHLGSLENLISYAAVSALSIGIQKYKEVFDKDNPSYILPE